MPRANRYFLPDHIWHITHQFSSRFQSFQPFNPPDLVRGPFKTLKTITTRRGNFQVSGVLETSKRSNQLNWQGGGTYAFREQSEAYGYEFKGSMLTR